MSFLYSSLHQSFGGWLKARRRMLSLSRSMVAERTNYSVAMLKKVELGQRKPSVELASLLFEVLKVPLDRRDSFFHSAHSGITEPALLQLSQHPPARPVSESLPVVAGNMPVHEAHEAYTTPPPRSQLPAPGSPLSATALMGREADVALIQHMLSQPNHRLITLVGPPGVGKTALARAVADSEERRAKSGEHGKRIVFVPLAEERDAMRLPECVAQALGLSPPASQASLLETIVAALQAQPSLMILDSVEHLLDAADITTHWIRMLLAASPAMNLLVTSRIPLHLSIEHTLVVEPLAVPNLDTLLPLEALIQFPSVKLLLERIQFYNPRFQMNAANIYAAAHLCVALDGLPLALELAAARTNALNLRMLLAPFRVTALDSVDEPDLPAPAAASGILALLTHGPRDLPERSRSLARAIGWSYRLLSAEEQRVFAALAVFPDRFSYAAAESAVGASVETLEALAARSLVQVSVDAEGELHFHLLNVIREYARLQLRTQAPMEAVPA